MTSAEPTQHCLNFTNSISSAPAPLMQENPVVQTNNEPHTVAGLITTVLTGISSFLVAAIPILQVIALLVSITVGTLTIRTWIKNNRKK